MLVKRTQYHLDDVVIVTKATMKSAIGGVQNLRKS